MTRVTKKTLRQFNGQWTSYLVRSAESGAVDGALGDRHVRHQQPERSNDPRRYHRNFRGPRAVNFEVDPIVLVCGERHMYTAIVRTLVWFLVAACVLTSSLIAQDSHPNRPSENRIFRFEQQTVTVEDFAADGHVLDIGGGGEGIIGLLKPAQVVAIDINRRELQDAPAGPLKIVMDATDMKFLDGSFKTATCFFTLMYMKPADQAKAVAEIFRVLAPGGRLLLWDVVIPERIDRSRDIAVYPLVVKLPGREITTGYGTLWPDRIHGRAYFEDLARGAGFRVARAAENGRTFRLDLVKP